jgi:hypothetical protein
VNANLKVGQRSSTLGRALHERHVGQVTDDAGHCAKIAVMAPNCKRPFERAPGSIISAGHKIVGGDTIGDGRNLRLGARFFDASQRERVGLEGARPSQSREQVRAVRKEHTFVSHVAGTSRQPERPLDERLRFRVSAQEQQYRNFLVQCERKMPLQSQILQTRRRRAHVVERDCIVSTRVFEAAETKQQPRSSCGAGRCPFECGPRPRDTIGQIPAAWEVEPKAENEVETDDPAERPIRR